MYNWWESYSHLVATGDCFVNVIQSLLRTGTELVSAYVNGLVKGLSCIKGFILCFIVSDGICCFWGVTHKLTSPHSRAVKCSELKGGQTETIKDALLQGMSCILLYSTMRDKSHHAHTHTSLSDKTMSPLIFFLFAHLITSSISVLT